MVAKRFDFTLRSGFSGRFTAVVDSDWLGDETILSATASTASALISVSPTVQIEGSELSVNITAIAGGVSEIHFTWVTNTGRGDCDTAAIKTSNC